MSEKFRPKRQEGFGQSPGSLFAGDPVSGNEPGGSVIVSHGPYMEHLPVGRMTIGDIRSRFSDRLDIDPLSHAVLDGHEADEDTVVRGGQLLTFIRQSGEKGSLPVPAGRSRDGEST